MMLAQGRRNTTAGGRESRLPPAQPTLASVSDTSLVLLSALLHPPQYQTRFFVLRPPRSSKSARAVLSAIVELHQGVV